MNHSHRSSLPFCAYCAKAMPLVWVHGHGQCAGCGVNVQPCCDGAPLGGDDPGCRPRR